jgi:hypothetical protein
MPFVELTRNVGVLNIQTSDRKLKQNDIYIIMEESDPTSSLSFKLVNEFRLQKLHTVLRVPEIESSTILSPLFYSFAKSSARHCRVATQESGPLNWLGRELRDEFQSTKHKSNR